MKLLAIPIALVLFQWALIPAINAAVAINAPRDAVPAARALGLPGARDVTFWTPDGVRLAAWYVPGANGAAVILTHGSHGDRTTTVRHLRMLRGAGYAVLAFDARGHGASSGTTSALGWQGDRDVAGAAAFLARQRGVDRARIAMLGLSMGDEEALRAAASGVPLAAVVATAPAPAPWATSASSPTGRSLRRSAGWACGPRSCSPA